MKADLIALTHYHGDHTFGLPGLLQTLGVQGRTAPLAITGPEGLEAAMAPILQLAGPQGFPVRLIRLPEGGITLNELADGWPAGARLTAFPTLHRVPSQGYCFTLARAGRFDPERARALGVPVGLWKALQQGRSVAIAGRDVRPDEVLGPPRRGLKFVFSGDTAECPALESAAREADLLICDATYAEDEQGEMAAGYGHMNFAQAAALAARAGVRRLWLAHYSQMIEDPPACLPKAQAHFPGAVCGTDGLSIRLEYEST